MFMSVMLTTVILTEQSWTNKHCKLQTPFVCGWEGCFQACKLPLFPTPIVNVAKHLKKKLFVIEIILLWKYWLILLYCLCVHCTSPWITLTFLRTITILHM